MILILTKCLHLLLIFSFAINSLPIINNASNISNSEITWPEYSALYIQFHHLNITHMKGFDDVDFIQASYDDNLQRELLKIRYRWGAADGDGDSQLNIDEFLTFRHPEMTGGSYIYMVDDILTHLDANGDQNLNITEFSYFPGYMVDNQDDKEGQETVKRYLEERQKEFRELDENKDGILTRDELLKAYNPLDRMYIGKQVQGLFSTVDDSPKDDLLSLEEIKKHGDVIVNMRILDSEKVLHEEM